MSRHAIVNFHNVHHVNHHTFDLLVAWIIDGRRGTLQETSAALTSEGGAKCAEDGKKMLLLETSEERKDHDDD